MQNGEWNMSSAHTVLGQLCLSRTSRSKVLMLLNHTIELLILDAIRRLSRHVALHTAIRFTWELASQDVVVLSEVLLLWRCLEADERRCDSCSIVFHWHLLICVTLWSFDISAGLLWLGILAAVGGNIECSRIYRGADKTLARPTSRYILFDGENISFDASLFIYINSTSIPPIMIINRINEPQNLLAL
jgi:hypothetical protein